MNKWLLIDSNFLCHRAYHSNGTIPGFFAAVQSLMKSAGTEDAAFFWDCGNSTKRLEILDSYKGERSARKAKEMADASDEEKGALRAFRAQMRDLRITHLKRMGFRNVFYQRGYEGDDLIASACLGLHCNDVAMIITADQDMYQCLAPGIAIYNPNTKRLMTFDKFLQKYHISPMDWADVKAIAGCSSDSVPGVPGVGEITAIKHLQNPTDKSLKVYKKILSDKCQEMIKRNLKLVRLPIKGTMKIELKKHKFNKQRWNRVVDSLGLKSLRKKG